ncbi:hypothetical protein JL193_14540 [Polaribacter batillariae]|uniref:Phenylacetate-CoA ligase n=1 Tax=Polaribacter batillariae TaxID=2808900 RepID=A0ABX7SST5_9FLAO|nr:hypothetical protein [Polaribacter batillariae]QTD37307.1 hypothetical protein JL193_14540 [Polaribacter batillariae]
MNIALFLKENLKNIPPDIGVIINKLPYGLRPGIGKVYTRSKQDIHNFDNFNTNQKQDFIFQKVKNIVNYSYNNIKFYNTYYKEKKFNPSLLKKFEDIKRIPIINKAILNSYTIDERSKYFKNSYKVNTGGTSGTPFSLNILPDSMGHEWAHMHTIWSKFEYKPSDLKLVFGGRSNVKNTIDYDVVRNHYAINIYADYIEVSKVLKKILKRQSIKYLHGYPSSIYDFATYCRDYDEELKLAISNKLNGVFLGSEYPHSHFRNVIEKTFNTKSISWYGHTERAVLAYERNEKFVYEPFQTYGFTEAIKNEKDYDLVSTSYYNYASPLIRYNTQDKINDLHYKDELLDSFKISRGREGEFVIDKNRKKISLTGLIFGRHHKLFDYAKFIQLKQPVQGKIIIFFVSENASTEMAKELFDAKNLNLDIEFKKVKEPYRTKSGKINLLIK